MAKKRSSEDSQQSPGASSNDNHPFTHNSPESPSAEEIKEWEEARCAVCMDHPHNAVLLVCSSYGEGCRPFICNTSRHHSNCYAQYEKAFTEDTTGKLFCPLCRGLVFHCEVVEEVRAYMNAKPRICSLESCEFYGNYEELRSHARQAHPLEQPSKMDSSRQQEWRRMEEERERADILVASGFNAMIGMGSGMDDFCLSFPYIDADGWVWPNWLSPLSLDYR